MKIPEGAIPDSTVVNFIYKKEGKDIEFDAEHFPADFNDSTYLFVKRYDKLIREGNAKPTIKDFVIITNKDKDTTFDVLNTPGKVYILFTQSLKQSNKTEQILLQIKKIYKNTTNEKIPIIAVSSDAENLSLLLSSKGINIQVCKGDLVAIKTAARSNPTLYLLEKGKILNKWGKADFHKVF